MKRIFLSFFFLLIIACIIHGQVIDTTYDCILKFKYFNFSRNNIEVTPLTIFVYPNGHFFLRNNYIDNPNLNETTFHSFINKRGRIIKQCLEGYKNAMDDFNNIATITNYFPIEQFNTELSFLEDLVVQYSIILHGLEEPILYKSNATKVFRVVFPCYNFSVGMFTDKPYQYFNSIRVNFSEDSAILTYKNGHFDENLDFAINEIHNIKLTQKEIKRLNEALDILKYSSDTICYNGNTGVQRLFEFTNDNHYSIIFRPGMDNTKVFDSAFYNGLYSKLLKIIYRHIDKQIYQCD